MAWGGEVQRKACGGVWSKVMLGMLVGLLVEAVSGAPAAMEPSSLDGEVGCARPLVDVVWGFLLTFLALSISLWTAYQHIFQSGDKWGKIISLLLVIFVPILQLSSILRDSFYFLVVVRHCHKMKYGKMSLRHLWSLLNPWSKSPLRILAGCDIIIYLQKGPPSFEESNDGIDLIKTSWIWEDLDVEDESEGMVVGEDESWKTKNIHYERKQLSVDGKLALIWGEYFSSKCDGFKFLPEYNQLKFLRGNSGFAVIAIAVQAIGYIYAVTFRSVVNLKVAPLEVIGLILNILLLIGASLYSTSNTCARSLVIYMNEKREQKFISVLKSRPRSDFDVNMSIVKRLSYISLGIIVICVCIPILVYFVIELRKATNFIVVMPLLLFVVGLFMSLLWTFICGLHGELRSLEVLIFVVTILVNMVAYVWAIIVTFYYWKSQLFNTRSQLLDWSQVIPFIG